MATSRESIKTSFKYDIYFLFDLYIHIGEKYTQYIHVERVMDEILA